MAVKSEKELSDAQRSHWLKAVAAMPAGTKPQLDLL